MFSRNNIEALLSTICFSVINILFLVQYFSIWGCLCALLTIAYYFYKINYLENKNNAGNTFSTRMGVYLGAFAMDMIAILFFYLEMYEAMPAIERFAMAWFWPVCLLVGALIALHAINKRAESRTSIYFYLRYIVLFVAAIILPGLYIKWLNGTLVMVSAIVVLLAMMVDSLNKYNSIWSGNAGFSWARAIVVVFSILSCLYGDFALYLVDRIYNYKVYGFAPWYISLLACLMIAICAIVVNVMKRGLRSVAGDTRVYISLIASIVLLWVLNSFSTQYDVVFLIIAATANAAYMLCPHDERMVSIFGADCSVISLQFVTVWIMAILLPISHYFGWLFQCICIFVALIGGYAFYAVAFKKGQSKINPPHQKWPFWQFLVTMAAAFATVVAYRTCNFVGNFVMIAAIYILLTAAFAILNYENKKLYKNRYIMRMIVGIAGILLFLTTFSQSKVKIKIDETDLMINAQEEIATPEKDDMKILVEINGKTIEPTKIYCYWSGTKDKFRELKWNADGTATTTVNIKNDCLNVVYVDENGVISTASRWFYDGSLIERIPVGQMILPEMDNAEIEETESEYE